MREVRDDLMKRVGALRLQVAAVGVVRGAGALSGDHGRAERMLRIAERAEGGAVVRLFDAPQDLAADADLGLQRGDLGDVEELFGVVRGRTLHAGGSRSWGWCRCRAICGRRLRTLCRSSLLRGQIALAGRGCASTDSRPSPRPSSSCLMVISMPSRMSIGSKPVTTMGTW